MTVIQLPRIVSLRTIHLLDWEIREPVIAKPQILKVMKHRRSRQSDLSRRRQAFISGMSAYRMSSEDMRAMRQYIEEWHIRISDNEW